MESPRISTTGTHTPQVESNAPVNVVESSQHETNDQTLPSSFEVEINSDGDEVLPKDKLRSPRWEHYQRVKTKDGSIKARCLFCKKKLVGDAKSGTTHLKDHYNSCTRRKLASIGQKMITPSFMMGEGKMKLGAYTFNQEYARQQLASMVVVHEYPLSIVDHLWFRRYSQALQPLFHVVSRNTLKKDIFRIYDVEKVKTVKLMGRNKSRISLTTDMWSAPNQERGFMVITAHFIDDSWKLQSRVLRFVYVPCPHTAEMLCEVMVETYLQWNIDRKLSTLTVDNASTNDAMISLLLEKFSSDCHMWHKSLFHVRCAAHVLNLIVRDGLDKIKGSIEKIRATVVFWKSTTRRREKFANAVEQLGIKNGKKLALDCLTRWNSTFLMLETAITYKEVFYRLGLTEKAFKCSPDSSDWELATQICKRLEIFYKVTELFSGTKYPTSNLFFINVCSIKLELVKWTHCEIEVVRDMAYPMREKFEKYWQNIHGILAVAAVLDPRYKMDLVDYYFRKIYGLDASCNVESIRSLCYDLLTVYDGKAKDKNSKSKAPSMPSTLEEEEEDNLSDFDSFVPDDKKSKSAHVKSELDYYLEEERLPRKGEFDILAWWKCNGLKFPTLQAIARDVLAVPVSSVASESSFSTSGRILRPNRSRLHAKTLEALMCTQSWLIAQDNEGAPIMPGNRVGDVNDAVEEDEDHHISDITSLSDCD